MSEPEGFRMALFEVILADGKAIFIDESPQRFVNDWVGVRTYKKSYRSINSNSHYFQPGDLFIIRPSMIIGFFLHENSEVIM